METRTIRQSLKLRARPHQVYEVMIDSRKHSRMTNSKARISRKVGGAFSVFDGAVRGRNLELVPDRKIVQSWYIEMDGWPREHHSRLAISLREIDGGTRLLMTHSGVPKACADSIREGWHEHYWDNMKRLMDER